MMKKSILVLAIITFFNIQNISADELDNFTNLNDSITHPAVETFTNKDYDDVVEALDKKKQEKDENVKKKKIKKYHGGGTSLHPEMNPFRDIKEFQNINKNDETGMLINLPVDLMIDNNLIEKGYYSIIGEKDSKNNKITLSLYQSQYFKGNFIATETNDDYGESEVNFAKLIPYNDSYVKIIFGSIDFNAYALIPFVK